MTTTVTTGFGVESELNVESKATTAPEVVNIASAGSEAADESLRTESDDMREVFLHEIALLIIQIK
uniref:Uncharacterized protein n=1 Tax=uncultured organism MedDCM-OCT-S09-C171 TaxID=743644 RepID=D6PJC9_9ZZZZ|nr:hypothetical protein [uncultured organism MedDCM-OCT-S09-C171]